MDQTITKDDCQRGESKLGDDAFTAPDQEHEQRTTLLDLSWDDIIVSQILPNLGWDDLYRLRSTCWAFKQIVDDYFKQLKSIDLTVVQCRYTTEAFQVATSNCTKLLRLIINQAKWITDKDLSKVFKNNPSLSFLDLSDCICLNGSCLLSLAVNCKQLHTLVLTRCNWITHGALETLIIHQDSIEVVDLTGCSRITNQILLPFVQKFQRLRVLRLAHIQTVNDTTLLLIARNCANSLEFLDVCGCSNISDRGVKMIAEYCKNLKTLHVAASNLVTEYSLSMLRARGVEIDRAIAGELVPYVPFYVQV